MNPVPTAARDRAIEAVNGTSVVEYRCSVEDHDGRLTGRTIDDRALVSTDSRSVNLKEVRNKP